MADAFITRCVSGKEREALWEAAQRVDRAWLAFEFASTRSHRNRHGTVTVRPLMPYLFCEGTAAQREHLMRLRPLYGPVWFIPDRQRAAIAAYQESVEEIFRQNFWAWRSNARVFHCQFKRGQSVRLRQNGMDLFIGKFEAVNPDGTYEIDGPLGRVKAEPGKVEAA